VRRKAVAHLLFLEGKLCGVREVLESAAPAAAEVGAGCLDPVGGRGLERLDDRPTEP